MARRLPPLNALKAFEAAARHQSLTKAAAELNVTHAAVSRHIRDLERTMRIPLFVRTGRGVVLTDAGDLLARDLTKAFDLLASATQRFARPGRRKYRLAITADTSLATYWLVPRLGRFTCANTTIDLVLDPTYRIVDLAKEDFDLGIRFGSGTWRDVDAEKFADGKMTVVCRPHLLAAHKVRTPADLPAEALIQDQDRSYWQSWLEAAAAGPRIVPSGPTLLADLTVAAAEAGHGFAMSDLIRASDALVAGRLVCPFDIWVGGSDYYIARTKGRPLSKPAADFCKWIKVEMAETMQQLAKVVPPRVEKRANRK